MTYFKQYKHLKVNSPDNDVIICAGAKSITKDTSLKQNTDSYSPTTLEDINSSKMSTTQICVIVVSLVAITLFILWYVLFR